MMIIPSQCCAGGKVLDTVRDAVLHDHRLSHLVDSPRLDDRFPGRRFRGGVSYVLWECPHCHTSRELLNKVGRSPWACRGCLRLPYRTQRMTGGERADRCLQRITKRLGVPGAGEVSSIDMTDWTPERPTRMRERTYRRLLGHWERAGISGAGELMAYLRTKGFGGTW